MTQIRSYFLDHCNLPAKTTKVLLHYSFLTKPHQIDTSSLPSTSPADIEQLAFSKDFRYYMTFQYRFVLVTTFSLQLAYVPNNSIQDMTARTNFRSQETIPFLNPQYCQGYKSLFYFINETYFLAHLLTMGQKSG